PTAIVLHAHTRHTSPPLTSRSRSLVFFLPRSPPPPSPPSFPYTTLFRSYLVTDASIAAATRLASDTAARPSSPVTSGRVRSRTEDRKSTRLNSSHLGISYAVFCSKKKS